MSLRLLGAAPSSRFAPIKVAARRSCRATNAYSGPERHNCGNSLKTIAARSKARARKSRRSCKVMPARNAAVVPNQFACDRSALQAGAIAEWENLHSVDSGLLYFLHFQLTSDF